MDTNGFLHLGDWRHPEFQKIVAHLGVSDHSHDKWIHTIVLYQARPGELSQDQIEQLHKTHPLARLAVVLGSWCEGETRSGKPLRGVERVFWYEALEFFAFAQSPIAHRTITGPESAIEHAVANRVALGFPIATIVTPDHMSFECLSDGLQLLGFTTNWARSISASESCALIVWDAAHHELLANHSFDSEGQLLGDTPRLALLNFPRLDQTKMLRELGFGQVLGKPFSQANFAEAVYIATPHLHWTDRSRAVA